MMSKRAIQLLTPLSYRGLVGARNDTRVIPIDASWYMPNNPRNPLEEFQKDRLPDSKFFDLDGVKDENSPYPHMLPTLSQFNKAVSELGIKQDDKLIIYDRVGNFSAPRVAWTFQTFGHENVYLLNNFPLYQSFSYPLETRELPSEVEQTNYESAQLDSNAVISFEQIVEIVSNKDKRQDYNILDARSHGRFTGEDPEPRAGLSSGHAPGAKNLPFSRVLGENNVFHNEAKINEIINELKLDANKPTIVMCGTGVTACILKAALDSVGFNKAGIQVYDGSWTEYAQRADKDLIVKGDA